MAEGREGNIKSLKDALTAALGGGVVPVERQRPSTVPLFEAAGVGFSAAARALKRAGARLAAEWAVDETRFKAGYAVYACYALGGEYLVVKTPVPADKPAFESLTPEYSAAYRFERAIYSLMGLKPSGHPDSRPWIKHEDWPSGAYPLRKSFDPGTRMPRVDGRYEWVRADGDEAHEIGVGPVHAGIIEPGHFRFLAAGEDVINLEERLGYVHKGIERRFEALGWQKGAALASRVSGDSAAAHSAAYAMAVEAAALVAPPPRAAWLRALMMERERIANHLGDIGAICNDAAFAFLNYQFSRLRETVMADNRVIFGHRFMMDRIVPGGVTVDIDAGGAGLIRDELARLSVEFERLVRIYEENPSLEDRVYFAGVLKPEVAADLGAVGFVARASGVNADVRVDRPHPPYDSVRPTMTVLNSCDVHARVWVRVAEVRDSFRIILSILDSMPDGPVYAPCAAPEPGAMGFAAVEGWRGEILYWAQAGPDGGVNRCMARDPSAVNWLCLERAIHGNIVPDFPLCNKSFNQSYSGNDL